MSQEPTADVTGGEFGASRSIRDLLVSNNKVVFVESVVATVVVWGAVAHLFGLTDVISAPTLVAQAFIELIVTGEFLPHLAATSLRVAYAFGLTLVVGTGIGLLMGLSGFWENAFADYIIVGMALPSLFAAVFAAMWFGTSDITPMVAGAVIVFPYLAQNVYSGVNDIDTGVLKMSSSFGVSRRRLLRRLVIPSVLPQWVAGVRYSLAICWKIVILAELFMADEGIGYMIQWELSRLSLTGILTWTLLFLLIMLFVEYGIVQQFEKRVFSWREDTSESFNQAT